MLTALNFVLLMPATLPILPLLAMQLVKHPMPKFYFLVDIRMNASSTGQNKFCNLAIIDNGAIVFS